MLLPMMAMADKSGTCGDNLTWTLVESTGTLTISGSGAMKNYSNSNTSTLAPWNSDRTKILAVVIENGVTTIGNYAFYFCQKLTSVSIPNSVTSIGSYAFDGCSSLISIMIPNSVTSIGEDAFRDCI